MTRVRVTAVSDRMVMLELPREVASCGMWCRFCPRTADDLPRNLPPADASVQKEVLVDVASALFRHRVPDVYLQSDDVLSYAGLFDLLEVLRHEGRRTHLATPGLRLAERSFAERFTAFDVRFDLTLHSVDPAVTYQMCGVPDAHDAILAALHHLAELGIDHEVGVVVTRVNVHTLADTVDFLASRPSAERVHVRVYYPDRRVLPVDFLDQFPEFDDVIEQLAAFDYRLTGPQEVQVTNLPPCQIEPSRFRWLRLSPTADGNTHPPGGDPICATCVASPGCARVHPAYRAAHRVAPLDPDRAARVLAWPMAVAAGEGSASGGPDERQGS